MRATLALIIGLVVSTLAAAPAATTPRHQTRPELSGTWVFADDVTPDRAYAGIRSNFGTEFTIEQDADGLTILRRSSSATIRERHTFDGAPNETRGATSVTVTRARWDGARLVIAVESTTTPPTGEPVTTVATRTLWREGDALVSEQVITSPIALRTVSHYRHPPEGPLPPAVAAPATISTVAWLGGGWATEGAATTEERWLPPAGGAMLGTSRTIARDRMVAFEFLRIVERDGSLVYIAQPGGRPPTEFVLTSIAEDRVVFENPQHDYPKMIAYTRSADTLVARISDAAGLRPQEFTFRRMPDGPSR